MAASSDPVGRLAEQLRATPPDSFKALNADALADLTESIRAARRRQAAELEAAGDQALKHIPKLLRGPLRKLLG